MTAGKRVTDLPQEASPVSGDWLLLVKADGGSRKLSYEDLPSGGGDGSVAWDDVEDKPATFPTVFSYCAVRNTDTATDINTASPTDIPFGGTVDKSHADFTLASDKITVNFDGTVNVQAHISQTGSTVRTNVGIWIEKNGTQVSGVGQSGYIRATVNVTRASSHISQTFDVSDGDEITVVGERRGNAGAATQISGESQVTVERRA